MSVKQEGLPPTEYLIMEVLAARYRLGENYWTFPDRLKHRLESLARRGLIAYKSSSVQNYQIAWLTIAGKACCLSPNYKGSNINGL